jgi:hypothetical protein
LEPARNNQRRRVRLAVDYEIDRWTADALCEVAKAALNPEARAEVADASAPLSMV